MAPPSTKKKITVARQKQTQRLQRILTRIANNARRSQLETPIDSSKGGTKTRTIPLKELYEIVAADIPLPPEADFVPNYDEDTSDGEGIDSTDGEETDSTECVESSCSDDGNLAPDEEAEAEALNYLKTSPRAVRGRRRALKKHVHIADRLEADSEIWRNKRNEELGDILKPERMGYFRLVGDPNGSIVQQQDGHYVDEASGERIKFSAFPPQKLANDYIDNRGEGVPVVALGLRDIGEELVA